MDILENLKEQNLITEDVYQSVQKSLTEGVALEAALLSHNLEENLVREQLAQFYGVPSFVPEDNQKIPAEVLQYVSADAAQNYEIIPLKMEDGVLVVGANDPENIRVREVLNFVSSKFGVPYKFVFLLDKDIKDLLVSYESLTGEVDKALTSLESELDQEIEAKKSENNKDIEQATAEHIKEDAPVTKIVATILRYAVDGSASDIHIEPTEEKIRVRFRVDGILSTSLELPKNVHSAVVARVKILSTMRLDEKRKPQDGNFSANFDGRKIDFRVSVLPTNHGEKVVMRILDNQKGVRNLTETGISEYNLEIIRKALQEPYGIILVSGPTGSGKTTTLYAMLEEIDKVSKNVLSLEDPVEYNIEGVSQSQVRAEIGYTFAAGLRSALRQDPDIIMVGEIRDKETAQLAVQAALTGHLVFSTIHTNNAIGVIPRLIDMGVDPYLIAPTLKLAMAQRLSRRLCPDTGREEAASEHLQKEISEQFSDLPESYHRHIPKAEKIIHAEPSPECPNGTKGRVAVMEVLPIGSELESLILSGGSEEDMYKVAREKGFISMKEDALIKSLKGTIPYEEVAAFGISLELDKAMGEEGEVVTPAVASVEAVEEISETEVVEPVDNLEVKNVGEVYNEGNV